MDINLKCGSKRKKTVYLIQITINQNLDQKPSHLYAALTDTTHLFSINWVKLRLYNGFDFDQFDFKVVIHEKTEYRKDLAEHFTFFAFNGGFEYLLSLTEELKK